MHSSDIRSRFLAFFAKRGHAIIPSASLVTADEKGLTNPTLFNTAGMQPLIPYLLGKTHPQGVRLADAQKCVRTVDIDDIGDRTHATFFEMLGNWSLGDYFKKEAIQWSYEFLTSKEEGLGLDPNRLYVTVFEGDANAPKDIEAATIWRDIFTQNNINVGGDTSKGETGRIFYLPAKNNWWEAGDNGPCGPDSEMFYDFCNAFKGTLLKHADFVTADDTRVVLEVWNDVFMQYEKKDGKIIGTLPKPSVDTGAGLERLTMTLQGVDNIYDTDLLKPVMSVIDEKAGTASIRAKRIIADHIRASVFLITDGVIPSNNGRGYILRRLIRRAVRYCREIGIQELSTIANSIIEVYGDLYDISKSKTIILRELEDERVKFEKALHEGLKNIDKVISKKVPINKDKFVTLMNSLNRDELLRTSFVNRRNNMPFAINDIPLSEQEIEQALLTGKEAFDIYQSHGLPIEMILELVREKFLFVDRGSYREEMEKHQDLSRSGAEQKFKGGLADAQDPMVIRYHTATHLLHQALHDVLGDGVGQKGSNITAERLRFDFSWGTKMTDEQKKKVEDIVNEKIAQGLPVQQVIMPKAEAEKTGARHFFGEKYGEEISIYFVGKDLVTAFSKEFCGGPHVQNTSELAGPEGMPAHAGKWKFKIQKEEASSQGVRRIKAVLG